MIENLIINMIMTGLAFYFRIDYSKIFLTLLIKETACFLPSGRIKRVVKLEPIHLNMKC